jgi:cellobiose-specific phosphotransferase system component IIB
MKKILIICSVLMFSAPMLVFATTETATVSSSVNAASEIDDLLSELEKVLDEFVLVAPQAKSGNVDATMKLATLSIQMSKLAEQLSYSKDKMSESQLVRFKSLMANMSAALI